MTNLLGIFSWLIDPIVKGIGDILSGVLKTLTYDLIWSIFIQGPLEIINVFNKIFNAISTQIVSGILFGTTNSQDFSLSKVNSNLWIFVAIAGALFGIFFSIQIIIIYFSKTIDIKVNILECVSNSAKCVCFIFLIPIGFFLINYTVTVIINKILINFNEGNTIADTIYYIGSPNFASEIKDKAPSNFSSPSDLMSYNIIEELVVVYFVLVVLFISEMSLFEVSAELFFLFLVGPVIMSIMVLDKGKRALIWKDMAVSRLLASSLILLGFSLYENFTSSAQSIISQINGGSIFDSLIQLGLYIGGAMSLLEFPKLSKSFLESNSHWDNGKRFINQTKNMMFLTSEIAGVPVDAALLTKEAATSTFKNVKAPVIEK